jgi:ATP-dependent Clp protease adaptor protein ClpS
VDKILSSPNEIERPNPSIVGSTVKPAPAPKETTERRVSEEPPYKVILHNDDFTPMEHVVEVLRKVIPRMSVRRAVDIMLEAHTKGKAAVPKTKQELAGL